jgi:hypothetical protein
MIRTALVRVSVSIGRCTLALSIPLEFGTVLVRWGHVPFPPKMSERYHQCILALIRTTGTVGLLGQLPLRTYSV